MLRIGELAAATGEAVRTLRYWEDEGLLTAERSASGYRLFSQEMVARASFLREAQALGLRLHEIRDLLALRSGGVPPCEHVRGRLREHLADVRARLRNLRALEGELQERLAWAEANPEPECTDGCVYLTPHA
ncbi:MAG: MerR family transcriptional regulator [Trueperaceae bacterium]|nr:MerR family transcriptional regulator [Trueperaceae bacterium]